MNINLYIYNNDECIICLSGTLSNIELKDLD